MLDIVKPRRWRSDRACRTASGLTMPARGAGVRSYVMAVIQCSAGSMADFDNDVPPGVGCEYLAGVHATPPPPATSPAERAVIERTITFDRAHRKFGPMITVRHRTVLGHSASNQNPGSQHCSSSGRATAGGGGKTTTTVDSTSSSR